MTARLLLGVTGHFFKMNSRYMFFAGALFTAVFRIGKLYKLLSQFSITCIMHKLLCSKVQYYLHIHHTLSIISWCLMLYSCLLIN